VDQEHPAVLPEQRDQVRQKPDYHLQVKDIDVWEQKNGRIPEGSVVFVRSDRNGVMEY
jgi:hypothetical protein